MSTSPAPPSRRLPLPLLLFGSAVLIFQLVWLVAVPPFGQMDEVDHAYRAASVAQGHFVEGTPSTQARGQLIPVPLVLAQAAHQQCSELPYQKLYNCSPATKPDAAGDVLVGSSAANRESTYYILVGVPAMLLSPHSGTGMLIVMRLITMLCCDLLLAAAIGVTARVTRSIWPVATVMATALPVLLAASVTVAPNGVQMAGGLLMWTCQCALIFADNESKRRRSAVMALWAFASCVVIVMHPTGPLWFLLSAIIAIVLMGIRRFSAIVRAVPRTSAVTVLVVGAVGVYSTVWTLTRGVVPVPGAATADTYGSPHPSDYLGQPIAWLLQCIGALPYRNNPAPTAAYAIGLILMIGLVGLALRRADRRVRVAIALILAAAIAISLYANFTVYSSQGNAWQGRYTLAFTYGIPLLAGWVLGTRSHRLSAPKTPPKVLAVFAGAALGLVNALTAINVRINVTGPKWSVHDGFAAPSITLIVVACVLGATLMMFAFERLASAGPTLNL